MREKQRKKNSCVTTTSRHTYYNNIHVFEFKMICISNFKRKAIFLNVTVQV